MNIAGSLAFWAVMAVAFTFGEDRPENDSSAAGDAVATSGDRLGAVFALSVLFGLYVAFHWVLARLGVLVGDAGVLVRTAAATYRFSWEQIRGFEQFHVTHDDLPRYWKGRRLPSNLTAVRVELQDDTALSLVMLNSRSPTTWFGSKPNEIAANLTACMPSV